MSRCKAVFPVHSFWNDNLIESSLNFRPVNLSKTKNTLMNQSESIAIESYTLLF